MPPKPEQRRLEQQQEQEEQRDGEICQIESFDRIVYSFRLILFQHQPDIMDGKKAHGPLEHPQTECQEVTYSIISRNQEVLDQLNDDGQGIEQRETGSFPWEAQPEILIIQEDKEQSQNLYHKFYVQEQDEENQKGKINVSSG